MKPFQITPGLMILIKTLIFKIACLDFVVTRGINVSQTHLAQKHNFVKLVYPNQLHLFWVYTVTCNKYLDKFFFCYIFHTKPYFFKATQYCHVCFDSYEINIKQGRITWRFIVYWLIILAKISCFFSKVDYAGNLESMCFLEYNFKNIHMTSINKNLVDPYMRNNNWIHK